MKWRTDRDEFTRKIVERIEACQYPSSYYVELSVFYNEYQRMGGKQGIKHWIDGVDEHAYPLTLKWAIEGYYGTGGHFISAFRKHGPELTTVLIAKRWEEIITLEKELPIDYVEYGRRRPRMIEERTDVPTFEVYRSVRSGIDFSSITLSGELQIDRFWGRMGVVGRRYDVDLKSERKSIGHYFDWKYAFFDNPNDHERKKGGDSAEGGDVCITAEDTIFHNRDLFQI